MHTNKDMSLMTPFLWSPFSGALNMHLKTHGGVVEAAPTASRFFCPVRSCPRHMKPYTRLAQLKVCCGVLQRLFPDSKPKISVLHAFALIHTKQPLELLRVSERSHCFFI